MSQALGRLLDRPARFRDSTRAAGPRPQTESPMQSPPLALVARLVLILAPGPAAAADRPDLVVQAGHANEVTAVAFSPDGSRLHSGSWDLTTGQCAGALGSRFLAH